MRKLSNTISYVEKVWMMILIIIILLIIVLTTLKLADSIENEMRSRFLYEAERFSSSITSSYLESLSGSESDTLLHPYQRLKSQLKSLRSVDPNIRFIYVLGKKREGVQQNSDALRNSDVLILIDSESPTSTDYSPPGQVYKEIPDEYRRVFADWESIVTKPVTDRWGNWITALIPLEVSNSDGFDMVLGVDIDARNWRRYIALKSILPVSFVAIPLVVVIVIGFVWRKRIAKNILNKKNRWVYPESFIVVISGVIISLFLSWIVHDYSKRNLYQTFQQMADSRISIFEDAIHDLWKIEMEGIARFYLGSEYVTTEEFLQYTGYLIDNRFVTAWLWVEVVSGSEIDRFQSQELEMNGKELHIWEESASGNPIPVSDRDVYFPVTRIAPKFRGEWILGLDGGTDSLALKAISEALESGLVSAYYLSGKVFVDGGKNNMLVMRPVFSVSDDSTPHGLVMALLELGDLLDNTLNDDFISATYRIVNNKDHFSSGNSSIIWGNEDINQMMMSRVVFAYGKNILVKASPTQHFFSINPLRGAPLFAFFGILISVLIAVIITLVKRRHQELEWLVEKRTMALRASQKHLAATLRSIGDGVITCNKSGYVNSLNKIAETLTGWTTEEANGKELEEIFHIIDAKSGNKADNPVRFVLEKGEPVELANHIVLISKSGVKYHIADSCAPIKDDSDRVTGAVLVFRDVTEAYVQREALKEERERLQYILDITGTGISIVDKDYNLIYVDEGWKKNHGDPKGEKCFKYFMNLDEPCENCNVKKAFDTKEVYVSEQISNDDKKVYEVHTIPFKNSKGDWLVAEFKLDISERKKSDDELQHQRLLLRTLIDNLPALIYVKDLQARKVISNIADFRNLGFEQEKDVIGKTDVDILGEYAKEYFEDDLLVLKTGQCIIDKEEGFVRKSGETVWLSTSKIPLYDKDGKVAGLVGIGHDITQKRMAEQELLTAKEKAEESDHLKTAFLHNMSHEIRTPLNAISGFADMLVTTNPDNDKRVRYASIIKNSSKQLLSIVNDILTISSIETNQEVLNNETVNINEITEELYAVFKQQVGAKDLEFAVDNWFLYDESLVVLDRTKVTQILSNLLGNAFKFTNSGFVKFGYVYRKESNELEFYVKDSGIGIAEESQRLIFERFRQANDDIHHEYGGTGLGLSICKGFAELMNGNIRLESKPGEGSSFYLTIPYVPYNKSGLNNLEPYRETLSEEKFPVLVAEDDELSSLFLKELLRELNCTVFHAQNGIQALTLFKQHKIDLVFMDVRMPEMDGYQAAREIKKLNPEIPIVVQSAYALSIDKEENKDVFDECIAKPLDPDMVKSLISKYRTKDKS
ncbi:PAS domain-containing protein [Natronoflexus pectinivorans]|uniref:histidine kinase n=1 Tax=Natronoflexus pectinivorans TaxID=682526 RepID=A0A4R2GIL3_9BACT|nr:PAS domain-containing protein [Natronoflexus pectinivorans]TCO08050.1 PAS domain S-box-containing protein [Natronoflexus pectinivorans]